MTATEIIQLITLLFSLMGTGFGAFGAYIAKKTRNDIGLAENTDSIRTITARLDLMDISDDALEKTGEQVRVRLVGLSGDNGLVHDIVKLKDQVAQLRTSVEVIADRLKVVISTPRED